MKPPSILPVLYLTLGWFGMQMAMALDSTQFQVMLHSKVQNAMTIGYVLSLGPIAGIIVQPLIGWYGDILAKQGISRERLMKVSGAVALLSTLALSVPMALTSLIVVIGVFYFSFNILMVSYRAMVTETSGRKALFERKGMISGFIALFSGAGSFTMFALCSVYGTTGVPFWVAGALLILTFGLFFRYAPRPKGEMQAENSMQGVSEIFGFWNLLFYAVPLLGMIPGVENRVCRKEYQRPIFRMFLVLFFSWVGIQALRGYFVLYATESLLLSQSMANVLLAILTLVMVGTAVPLGKLADTLDNRLLYRYSLLFFAAVSALSFITVHSLPMAVVMSILLGMSFAGMVVAPLSLLFKLCPPKNEGIYAGLYNLFLSVPQLYSLVITGWLIDRLHDYHIILLVAGIAVTFGFLLSFRMPPVQKPLEVAV